MNSGWLFAVLLSIAIVAVALFLYPLKLNAVKRFFAGIILLGVLAGLYFSWGGFSAYYTHEQNEYKKVQAKNVLKNIKSTQDLITQLKSKLDDTPKSAKGWYLLGRLYLSQKNQQQAVEAFAKAYGFFPDNEQYAINYAHALWEANQQQFTPQIISLFTALLQQNPDQPDALVMLAMNAFLSHAYEDAIHYWQRLLRLMPPQSKEALAIQKAIAKAQERLKKE